jgi:hypothetical protein
LASGYPTNVHWLDETFLKLTTTRRIVLAASIGPLLTARSAPAQLPGVLAAAPPPPPSLGGPPASAGAAAPIAVAANTIAAKNVPDAFMLLQLLDAVVAIQFGTLRLMLGANKPPDQ